MVFSSRRRVVALLSIGVCFLIFMIFSAYPRHTLHSQKNSNIVGHYEFSSSSNSQPPPSSRDPPAPIAVIFPDPFAFHQPTPGEKYITYLPHSGFHNQRIELENALLLASYLNRTLLLPPVFLGNPAMPWLRYEKMYERLLLQTKRGLEHCPRFEPDESIPAECLNYFRWTSVPWSFFYDMGVFQDKVRIVQRNDLSLEWMYESLGLTEKNVRFMRDMSPYEFRVYDNPASTTPLAKFVNRIELASLEAIQEPLIHFGSVFGTYRVLAQTEEHAELLRFIRTHMIFKNPVLVDTTARIVEQLGGVGSFVGLHIRVGDGLFKVRASINVDDIYHELVNKFTDLDVSQVKALEEYKHDQDRQENTDYEVRQLRKFRPLEDTAKPVEVHHPPAAELEKVLGPRPEIALPCQAANSVTEKFQKTVIYIATDASDPRNNPLLRKIFATFPCVFTLSDFAKELSDLQRIQVVEEKVKLTSYLIPMLDAMISAQGHTFFGTKDSTFSSYIERQLHPVYTNKEVKVMKVPGKQATAAVTTTQPIDGNFHP